MKDLYSIVGYDCEIDDYIEIFSGSKEEAEKFLSEEKETRYLSESDIDGAYEIYKNGERVHVEKYVPVLE